MSDIVQILTGLYGAGSARKYASEIERAAAAARSRAPTIGHGGFDQRDAVLITYPDIIQGGTATPLETLRRFCVKRLADVVSIVHLLPFFPSSSDDGFAVVDHRAVDPSLGTWDDIERLRGDFRLMFDAVFNHVSSRSAWFQEFLRGDAEARWMFIVVPVGTDVSRAARPRAHPLLTPFHTASGEKLVWTTFGPDQIDLNFSNPQVLLRILETLLSLVEHGAALIRLDAIAYVWKRVGTRCIHLPQVHLVVQLFRAVLDRAAPRVALVTETNAAHAENVSYFGDGANEAQLVYNFPLPPLVLHAFHAQDSGRLSEWAAGLSTPSARTTFLNFLASHDGIGVIPARGILLDEEIELLVRKVLAHGGLVSYRANADGSLSPYELNINYWDALADPDRGEELGTRVDRFLAAHAIMLALRGVPALYFHSLIGSTGWPEGVILTGSNRSINRRKLDVEPLEAELDEPGSQRARVFLGLARLLAARRSSRCFHPQGGQRILAIDPGVFALVRTSPGDGAERVLCVHNMRDSELTVAPDLGDVFGALPYRLMDIVSGGLLPLGRNPRVTLRPFQVSWLQAVTDSGAQGTDTRGAGNRP